MALAGNLPKVVWWQRCFLEAASAPTAPANSAMGQATRVWWSSRVLVGIAGLVGARGGPTVGLRTKVEDVVICAHKATLDVAGLYLARQLNESVCVLKYSWCDPEYLGFEYIVINEWSWGIWASRSLGWDGFQSGLGRHGANRNSDDELCKAWLEANS